MNSSSSNKILTDLEIKIVGNRGGTLFNPLYQVDHFIDGNQLERNLKKHETEYFKLISLKPGEVKAIRLLSFIETDFVLDERGIKEIDISFKKPDKFIKKKARRK
ncbi:hypothetical protein CV093_04490 [Oceanobacillus sp. 143]|nr:hypothetical protein CV093_04490 [Oceanobacillus sp. 143]